MIFDPLNLAAACSHTNLDHERRIPTCIGSGLVISITAARARNYTTLNVQKTCVLTWFSTLFSKYNFDFGGFKYFAICFQTTAADLLYEGKG